MGGWKPGCFLCGVEFNMARIRTPHEPREHAWDDCGRNTPGTTYTRADNGMVNLWIDGCPSPDSDDPESGCMMAFREDTVWRERCSRALGAKTDEECDGELFDGLGERPDLGREDTEDGNWLPEDQSQSTDEEDVVHEFDSDPERDMDDAGFEEDDDTTIDLDIEEAEYRRFVAMMDLRPIYPRSSFHSHNIRPRAAKLTVLAEELRERFTTEVQVSLYEPGKHTREGDRLQDLSLQDHPLNAVSIKDPNAMMEVVWEHLAGPRCIETSGYSGHRISFEEMQYTHVVQAMIGADANTQWESESDDEEWEGKGTPGWYLLGLMDNAVDRQSGSGKPWPERHKEGRNVWITIDDTPWNHNGVQFDAMTFHPTCLEVFKRVSLHRRARFDINALGNWWRSKMDVDTLFGFPRVQEVKDAVGSDWSHVVGDEYLAADPCFVPELTNIMRSSISPEAKDSNRLMESGQAKIRPQIELGVPQHCGSAKSLSALPVEIQSMVLAHLENTDVASLCIACPMFKNVAEACLQARLLREMPYLWELWCDMPYSRWTGTTMSELKAGQHAFDAQQEETERALSILEEEGHEVEYAHAKKYWADNRKERRDELRGAAWQEKPAGHVDPASTDFTKLVLKLDQAQKKEQLKGLKNRQRIWTDCGVILDRIEAWQEEQRISPS